MTRKPLITLVAAAILAAPLSAGAADLSKDFDVLNNKNIFSKHRIIPHRDANHTQPVRPPRPPKVYTPVLIGAMLEDDGYVAFIVDPKSREIVSVRAGDVLPNGAGTVKDITLDYITTEHGSGKPVTKVAIGQNILGGTAEFPNGNDASAENAEAAGPSTQGGAASSAGSGAQSGQPSGPPSSGGNVEDIAERLRKRRMQQLGK
ncbi:MAG: hypothetical protein ACTHN5_10710 [Phycisphaerae bacterium]